MKTAAVGAESTRIPSVELDEMPLMPVSLVLGEAQNVSHTPSRRAEPRAWLRAVMWLVDAGIHPRSGPTTLAVAQDLADRMDYQRGLVMYGLDTTARRTRQSVATVKRHVKVLRELGALAWWRHGSKRNLRLPGRAYTATSTIYAAVIPPVYDDAMGHRLAGSGYEARVCGVTEAGRERAVTASAARSPQRGIPVDNRPVDKSSSGVREPHSPGRYHQSPEAKVESGSKDTSRQRASRRTASPSLRRAAARAGGLDGRLVRCSAVSGSPDRCGPVSSGPRGAAAAPGVRTAPAPGCGSGRRHDRCRAPLLDADLAPDPSG